MTSKATKATPIVAEPTGYAEQQEVLRADMMKLMQERVQERIKEQLAQMAAPPAEYIARNYYLNHPPPSPIQRPAVNAEYVVERVSEIMDHILHGRYERAIDAGEYFLQTIETLISYQTPAMQPYPAIPPNPVVVPNQYGMGVPVNGLPLSGPNNHTHSPLGRSGGGGSSAGFMPVVVTVDSTNG